MAAAVLSTAVALLTTSCGTDGPPLVFSDMTTTTTVRSSPVGDDTTLPTAELGPWVDVTGSLTGQPSECGNLAYLTGDPNSDRIIASVAGRGLWSLAPGTDQWNQLGGGSTEIRNRGYTIVFDPADPARWWESGAYSAPGVVRTTNNGGSFEALGGIGQNDGLSVDFTDPDRRTMLVGVHERGELLRSTDGGGSWVNVAPAVTSGVFPSQPLVIDSQTYLVGASNGPTGEAGIFRTTDGAATWTKLTVDGVSGPPLVASDGTIYWVLQNGGMVSSTDKGVTWINVTSPSTLSSYNVVELADGRIASIGTTNAVVSSDKGFNWGVIGPSLPTLDPFGIAYSAAQNALFLYTWDCTNVVPPNAVARLDLAPPAS